MCHSVMDSYAAGRVVPPTSWYLLGSFAVGDAVELSDVDLLAITEGPVLYDGWDNSERSRWRGRLELHQHYIADLALPPLVRFLPMLSEATRLAGDELRAHTPQLDITRFRATAFERFHAGVAEFSSHGSLIPNDRRSDGWPAFVVDAPDWTEEAFWTHELVLFLSAGATAVGAASGLVASSRPSAISNLAAVPDASQWATFVAESVEFLRAKNSYRVLDEESFRQSLEAICTTMPAFVGYVLDRIARADP
jgi:hypothetical protein